MLLKNIKSDYILKHIFSPLERVKCEIIRYNKKLKNRLEITINHYKELYKKYNIIEVDIILRSQYRLNNSKLLSLIKSNCIHVYVEDKEQEITEIYAKGDKKNIQK